MTLNVVIATLNRGALLRSAIDSLRAADAPPDLTVTITVVDNGSVDDTQSVVEGYASSPHPIPVRYLLERRRGQAFALNAGIARASTDLIGLIDDDEKVDANWYKTVVREFGDPSLDFVGGPYIPSWVTPPPKWLPRQKAAVIGWLEMSSTPKPYGDELPNGTLCGGNAVMRRSLLERAGLYRTDLSGHHDLDMFRRFMAVGARGRYIPDLIIYHHIPPERLEKSYFRRWIWKAGVSYARIRPDREARRTIAGIPLYVFKRMGQSMIRSAVDICHPIKRFEAELDFIYFVSFAYTCLRYPASDNGELNAIEIGRAHV